MVGRVQIGYDYDNDQPVYYYSYNEKVRIVGVGMIDFCKREFVYESDGSSKEISPKTFVIFDLLCRYPQGISAVDLKKKLKEVYYGFSNRDILDIRRKILKESGQPYKYLVNKNNLYFLNTGHSDNSKITLFHIHETLKRYRLLSESSKSIDLVCDSFRKIIKKDFEENTSSGIETKEGELIQGNGIHIKENLERIYIIAEKTISFRFHFEEEFKYLKTLIHNASPTVPLENLVSAIQKLIEEFPGLGDTFFTFDVTSDDIYSHPYEVLTTLCLISIYKASDCFNLTADERFISIKSKFSSEISRMITDVFEGNYVIEPIPGIEIPIPFSCANYWKQLVCDDPQEIKDGYSFSFDYSRLKFSPTKRPWASLVFKFREPVILTGKKLSFDLRFDSGNFSQIDVEIKKKKEDTCREPSVICNKKDRAWHHFDYDCDNLSRDVRKCLGEICFVVNADYATKKADMLKIKGRFSVRNLQFIDIDA